MEARSHTFLQILKIGLLGMLIFSAVYAISQIRLSQYFPIRGVQVYGINRVDHDEVEASVLPLVSHGFFSINVEAIRERLLQIPWVANTYVRRMWPDQVSVTVQEKVPVAKWNAQSLLSNAGELFTPKLDTYPDHLATFTGPEGQHILMLQYYYEINRLLKPLHARISSLELTPYSAWKVKLDTGMILQMGHKDVLTRLSHFVTVYPKIIGGHEADVDYVDLRYSNGIAIRWKKDLTVEE
jgi:cell division protein FtsQ